MLWMRGSFLHSSVPRPLCDCPQDRTYRTWDRTSSFVTYRWILEPMSETMFVRAPSSWLWLLKTGDFCSPFWRSRLVLSKTTPLGEGPWDGGASCGHFFPCPHSNRCLAFQEVQFVSPELLGILHVSFGWSRVGRNLVTRCDVLCFCQFLRLTVHSTLHTVLKDLWVQAFSLSMKRVYLNCFGLQHFKL